MNGPMCIDVPFSKKQRGTPSKIDGRYKARHLYKRRDNAPSARGFPFPFHIPASFRLSTFDRNTDLSHKLFRVISKALIDERDLA